MEAEIKAKPELKIIKEDEIPHLLLPGEVGAILELIVTDKDGNVTEQRVIKSKSFVRQFLELLWILGYPINENLCYSLRDTSNAVHEVPFSAFALAASAPVTNTLYGIVIGTGAVAPTIDDYQLGAQIPHATMNYSAVTFGLPANDATTSQFTITRNFSNVSGGPVTVTEIALYVLAYRLDTAYYVMVIRDVIAGGIAVPAGQTLTVNYRPQAVV